MKKGTKYKKMTRVSYGQVKSLLNADIKPSLVSKATGIGRGTVNRIKNSKDWRDYKENMLEYYRVHRKSTMPKNTSVVSKKADSLGDELSTAVTRRLDAQTEVLKEILKELKAKKIKLF